MEPTSEAKVSTTSWRKCGESIRLADTKSTQKTSPLGEDVPPPKNRRKRKDQSEAVKRWLKEGKKE